MSDIILLMIKFLIPSLANLIFLLLAFGYKSKIRLVIGLVLYAILMIPGQIAVIFILGKSIYLKIVALLTMLVNGSIMLITSPHKFFKALFLLFLSSNISFLLSIISNTVYHLFNLSLLQTIIFMLPLFAITLYLGLRFCAKPLRFMVENVRSNWLMMMLGAILSLAAGVLLTAYSPILFVDNPLFFFIISILIEGTFMLYIYNLYKNVEQNYIFSKEQLHKEMLVIEIDSYEKMIAISKASRHDMRHHNNVLMEYLADNDINGAKQYLSDYSKNLDVGKLESYCENSAANAVLRVYMRTTKHLYIDYAVTCDIPQNLPINSTDFSSMLSNLLENACEAAEKVTIGKRYLSVYAVTDNSTLNIEIKNSCKPIAKFDGELPSSTKKGGGIGLLSVKIILSNCGGMMEITQSDNEFLTRIIIPLDV